MRVWAKTAPVRRSLMIHHSDLMINQNTKLGLQIMGGTVVGERSEIVNTWIIKIWMRASFSIVYLFCCADVLWVQKVRSDQDIDQHIAVVFTFAWNIWRWAMVVGHRYKSIFVCFVEQTCCFSKQQWWKAAAAVISISCKNGRSRPWAFWEEELAVRQGLDIDHQYNDYV